MYTGFSGARYGSREHRRHALYGKRICYSLLIPDGYLGAGMNVQQLRYVRETIRQGLNLTAAASALHTSQPGISRQIRELEHELGVEFFVRRGKRVIDLTEPGRALAPI